MQVLLTDWKCKVAYPLNSSTINKPFYVFELGIFVVFNGNRHRGCAFGLYTDNFCIGGQCLKNGGQSCCQAAAANSNKNVIYGLFGLFYNFQSNCCLTLNYLFVIKGVNKCFVEFLTFQHRSMVGIIVGIAYQPDFNVILAKHINLFYFLFGCWCWHVNGSFYF